MFEKTRYLVLVSMLAGSVLGLQACGGELIGQPDSGAATCDPACPEGCTCYTGVCKDADGSICVSNDVPDEPEVCEPACPEGCQCENGSCVDDEGNACVADSEIPDVCEPECTDGCVCENGNCIDSEGNFCGDEYEPEVCEPACREGCTCLNGACVNASGDACIDEPEVCDPACKEGCTCQDGACVDGSGNACVDEPEVCDPACKEGCTCQDGACVDGSGNACVDEPEVCDPACQEGCSCQDGACVDGEGNACVKPEGSCYPECTGSSVCFEGKCVCPDNLICEGLTCDPECAAPSVCNATTGKCECPEGETCETLVCEPECAAPAACVNGKCVCPEGETCADAPTCDGDCVSPAVCLNGACICPDGANCDGTSAARVCEPACEGLYECVNGKCECPEGKDCTVVEPVCDPACTGKYTCVEGTCVCPAGETCETTGEPEDDSWLYETEDCAYVDSDGDLIADLHEGRAEKRDSDGDGTPDYLDEDSDNDGVPDKIEGETRGCSGESPRDRDGDKLPNYLDTDSDNNGIPDGVEIGDVNAPMDSDGDKLPDYLDRDNDGDTVLDANEILGIVAPGGAADSTVFAGDCNSDGKPDTRGSVEAPIDCDGDTTPDYMDTDSDGDGIPDVVEASVYFNNWYIRYIKDADANGIVDGEEGYTDLDGDGIPNHLDLDNDNDGLSDVLEQTAGSDPNNADTDGDGANDLVEWAAGTDPKNAAVNPVSEGNFVFVVPYKAETTPKKQTLSFVTGIQMIDLYFSFDQSGSMSGEFKTLGNNINKMLDTMRCRDYGKACTENSECSAYTDAICSEAGRCIANPTSGDGCFADMWTGFGTWGNVNRFINRQSLSANSSAIATTLLNYSSKYGFDKQGSTENSIQPPICAIFGSKYCGNNSSYPLSCYTGTDRFGCVGYRKGAIKVYIQAGDESNAEKTATANGTTYSWKVADAATWGPMLKNNKVRYVGLWGSTSARNKGIRQMAQYAGSCAKSSCVGEADANLYMAQITDSNVNTKAVQMIREIAKNMPMEITSTVEDMEIAGVKNLIENLNVVVNPAGASAQGRVCQTISNTIITGQYQGIKDLKPGVVVCYDVYAKDKQSLFPATREPQLLKARIKVMGDGSVLNSGIAYFVVPPDLSNNFGN